MNPEGGLFRGARISRWLQQLSLSFMLFLAVVGLNTVVFETCHESGAADVFFIGLGLTTFSWLVGLVVASRVTTSADDALWSLTPLTLGRYYGKNALRIGLVLLTAYVAVPLATLCLAGLLSRPEDLALGGAKWHFRVNTVLFYHVALAVSLGERITRRRTWTCLVFVLRHPVRWLRVLAAVIAFALLITSRWWSPVAEPVVRRGIEGLMNAGVVGHLVVFLVSPISAMAAAARSPFDSLTLWVITVFLLAMLGLSIFRIVKAIRRSPSDIELERLELWQQHQHEWVACVERYEAEQDENDEEATTAFASPETDRSLADERAEALAYEEKHLPEAQVVRHGEYWRRRELGQSPHIFAFLIAHLWPVAVLVAWAIWLSGVIGNRDEYAMFFPFALFACAHGAFRLQTCMATGAGTPLRWPKLIARQYVVDIGRHAIADFFAALLMARTFDYAFDKVLVLFAYFLAMRLCWHVGRWMWSLRYAGRKWWARLYASIFGASLVTMCVSVFILYNQVYWHGRQTPPLLPLYLFAGALGLLVLAWLFLGLVLWKRGTDVLGWSKEPEPFGQEAL